MTSQSPFHKGEQRVQERLGVREMLEPWAQQVVRSCLPEAHRIFHSSLPFLVAAARDVKGRPWATLLVGRADFVRSPDPQRLTIDAQPVPGDALYEALVPGSDLGLLGIEFDTRRRNRANGYIESNDAGALVFKVDQSFGNCPQYIHERSWRRVPVSSEREPAHHGDRLTPAMQEWIRQSDTFFIATGHGSRHDAPVYGMDVSHRGGDPGFVEIESDTRIVFPDYSGNNHYNTIGNLFMDPRAGVLFVGFERGSLLQLTGRAEIDWESEELSRFPGAKRLVAIDIEKVVELDGVLPLRWSASNEFVRTLRLIDKIPESKDVTSFVFEARDGGPLPDFEAGQHLPIQLQMPGLREPVRRTYSLSNGPGQNRYRISVKREPKGLASRFLHDSVEVGDFIDARRPAGEFVLSKANHPVVLVSAGIGLTPMLSMFHELADGPMTMPVWFIHGARNGNHHPLSEQVREIVDRRANANAYVIYSDPRDEDKQGVDFNSSGRVDAALIAELVPELEANFYLCGPPGFMADIRAGLIERGVHQDHIHWETFGPVGCASCG